MAQRDEIVAVYAAGLIQDIALVTFPATGTIFTSPAHYGLSDAAYGGMFGYGIAAFGVRPLESGAGLGMNTIYGGTAIIALAMSGLSFVIVRHQVDAASAAQ